MPGNFLKKFENIYGYLFFALLAASLVFLRKPETLLHAQLWAEDGKIWFAQAYNIGAFKSLLISDGGYFQTFSRLAAALGLLVPLSKVPLLLNSIEFLLQLSPALLLLTPRLKNIGPKIQSRLLLAGLYLLLPNTAELDGHITSSQWYLAVLAFLVLVASPAVKNKLWQFFDAVVLLLSGLTGTFAIFLIPVAAVLYKTRRGFHSGLNLCLIFFAGVLQAASVFLLSHENRVHVLPELTAKLFFAIFSRQVVWGLLSGARGYLIILSQGWLIPLASVLAIVVIIYALVKGPLELKLFLVFGLAIFAASLITPTKAALSYPILKVLSRSTDGIRYWFIPMLSFASALVWGLSRSNRRAIRFVCALFLCFSIFGIVLDFRHHPYPDNNFGLYVEKFLLLPKGERLSIPITPPGWQMELVKH